MTAVGSPFGGLEAEPADPPQIEYAVRWTGDEDQRVRLGAPRVTPPVASRERAELMLSAFGGHGELVERLVGPWRAHDLIECGCELSAADAPPPAERDPRAEIAALRERLSEIGAYAAEQVRDRYGVAPDVAFQRLARLARQE